MDTFVLRTNVLSRLIKNVFKIRKNNYTSALFIPGSKATKTFSFLSPYLDFDKRFEDITKLQYQVNARDMNIDVKTLKDCWDFYKHINSNKRIIENKRDDITQEIKNISKKNNLSEEDENKIERLKTQGIMLRKELKSIKEILWELEETVIVRALKLPNELDEKVPLEPVIMTSVGKLNESISLDNKIHHIDVGKRFGLIEYINPLHYYLCKDAVLFELATLSWIKQIFDRENLIQICGADFSRSLVIEGAGLDHESIYDTFILDNNENIEKQSVNRLHLVGSASFISFLTMHTKQLINPKDFPLKYYASGRQYTPYVNNETTINNGLFNVSQESVINCFLMTILSPDNVDDNQLQNLINIMFRIYNSLGLHYRVVLNSAKQLKQSESLRISFQCWSTSLQSYVEVGHLSTSGNFISKRLLIAYQTPTGRDYPSITSGTILSIPKLLACILENNPNKFEIPPVIVKHFPTNKI